VPSCWASSQPPPALVEDSILGEVVADILRPTHYSGKECRGEKKIATYEILGRAFKFRKVAMVATWMVASPPEKSLRLQSYLPLVAMVAMRAF
jgi:hypothetical protein